MEPVLSPVAAFSRRSRYPRPAYGELADPVLVKRARAGDEHAFAELTRRHHVLVYGVALRMLRDAGDAEDATQEAFLRAWRGLAGFRGDSSFGTWMYRIVANRCIRSLTRRHDEVTLPDTLISLVPDAHRTVEARRQVVQLEQVIHGLPPSWREPLLLFEIQGCSYDQIAELLGISTSAVRARLHRARQRVREDMWAWR